MLALRYFCIFATALIMLLPINSFAHGGGLDSTGGHNDRKRGTYHCHRAPCGSSVKVMTKKSSLSQNTQANRRSNNQLRTAQTLLIAIGYDIGVADGIPGNKTQNAIKAFQTSHSMLATGEVDDTLILALSEEALLLLSRGS